MTSLDQGVMRQAMAWLDRGHRVVLGTVVRSWGSAPRPPGSLMAIRDDGQVSGSLSGGCIEDDLIDRLRRGELASRLPQAVVYGATAAEAQRFGLPCGGSVQIVLEPLGAGSRIGELLARLDAHQRVERRLDLASGAVALNPAGADADADIRPRLDEAAQQLRTVHGPALRLLLIGGGQLSRLLAQMALPLGYQVTVGEPRAEYHEAWAEMPEVVLAARMPDDLVLAMRLDASSAVLALSHDPKLDDLALIEALRTPAFYVGALGSRRNNEARRERLRTHFGLFDAELARLHGPIGLNLGAQTPAEIALAVLAELTARRRGVRIDGALGDWSESSTPCRSA